jgi:hypothetical protein
VRGQPYAGWARVPRLGEDRAAVIPRNIALPSTSRQATQTKELQHLLGDHLDSVVARIVLLDLAQMARAAGEDTFTYGLMHQRQACQAAAIEQTLPRLAHGHAAP